MTHLRWDLDSLSLTLPDGDSVPLCCQYPPQSVSIDCFVENGVQIYKPSGKDYRIIIRVIELVARGLGILVVIECS